MISELLKFTNLIKPRIFHNQPVLGCQILLDYKIFGAKKESLLNNNIMNISLRKEQI